MVSANKAWKAPGPDNIHAEFLIHGDHAKEWLQKFFNKCLLVVLPCKLPRIWRRATVIAILIEGHIYHHLVESLQGHIDDSSDIDDLTLDSHTSKPLRRGKQFFVSGHITDMKDNLSADKLCYYVKANVLASMKQVSYETVVTLSVNSGFVLAASCQCKASALGRCSHVGAFCR